MHCALKDRDIKKFSSSYSSYTVSLGIDSLKKKVLIVLNFSKSVNQLPIVALLIFHEKF
jgi:hypothetical protein